MRMRAAMGCTHPWIRLLWLFWSVWLDLFALAPFLVAIAANATTLNYLASSTRGATNRSYSSNEHTSKTSMMSWTPEGVFDLARAVHHSKTALILPATDSSDSCNQQH